MYTQKLFNDGFEINGLTVLKNAVVFNDELKKVQTVEEVEKEGGELASLYSHITQQTAYLRAASKELETAKEILAKLANI